MPDLQVPPQIEANRNTAKHLSKPLSSFLTLTMHAPLASSFFGNENGNLFLPLRNSPSFTSAILFPYCLHEREGQKGGLRTLVGLGWVSSSDRRNDQKHRFFPPPPPSVQFLPLPPLFKLDVSTPSTFPFPLLSALGLFSAPPSSPRDFFGCCTL